VQVRSSLDSAQLDFIHRRTATDEIYFVRNTRRASCDAHLTFRTSGKTPQLWNPADGTTTALPIENQTTRTTTVHLRLDPLDAFFVVFRQSPKPLPVSVKAINPQPVAELAGPWELRFPHGWGTPSRVRWTTLHDWTTDTSAAIRHFSGVVAYHRTFDGDALAPGGRCWLDLGDVREIADVWLNGHHLGERAAPPYQYEITRLVKPGTNYLTIEVANTLNNRLVGDAKRPAAYRQTKSNLLKGITAWKTPWAEVPLIPSGLLGPVTFRRTVYQASGTGRQAGSL